MGSQARAIAIADVNGNSKPDLLTAGLRACYNVSKAGANAVVELVIGSKKASQRYEGERRFRFQPEFRKNGGKSRAELRRGSRTPISRFRRALASSRSSASASRLA